MPGLVIDHPVGVDIFLQELVETAMIDVAERNTLCRRPFFACFFIGVGFRVNASTRCDDQQYNQQEFCNRVSSIGGNDHG